MNPKRITIHCSATKNGTRVPAEEIKKWHLDRGFSDIGYHLVIQPDGEVEKGRPLNQQGAHVEGENENNIGICLIGTDRFSQKQFDSLRYQIDAVTMIYNIEPWELWAHNQFKSAQAQRKICPGMTINRLLTWYLVQDQKAIETYLFK